jgi:hypothetical protein
MPGFPAFPLFILSPQLNRQGDFLLPKPVKYILIVLIVLIGLLAMYSIFNAGNPNSLLRRIFPDANHDVTIAFVSSLTVFIIGFFIFFDRDRQGFRELVKMNADQIKKSREQGQADGAIADSILSPMGSTRGYRHKMARKKLLIALSEFHE